MAPQAVRSSEDLVTIESIREASRGLDGVAVRSPLVRSPALEAAAGVPVYFKLENEQPTGAFKLRGAWTAVRRLTPTARRRGVVTFSSGNHGQAVAYAARRLAVRAVVVMPENAPAVKVDGVRQWRGEVVFAGTTSEDRRLRALELVEREGLSVIPPFDHPDIIAGQGTVGLEIADDLPEVATVVVPVGGGGLLAGVATALRGVAPTVRVVAVEPDGAAALGAALAAGHVVRLPSTRSVADGLLPLAVGTLTFDLVRDRVEAVTVTDDAIEAATGWLARAHDVVAEPSGAATTAALRVRAFRPIGPTVLIVSGGNVDPEYVRRLARDAS